MQVAWVAPFIVFGATTAAQAQTGTPQTTGAAPIFQWPAWDQTQPDQVSPHSDTNGRVRCLAAGRVFC